MKISWKNVRSILEFTIVSVCTLLFLVTAIWLCFSIFGSAHVGRSDFSEYWASGQLLKHHANPYARGAVLDLERSIGFSEKEALVMWNLPSALLLVLPLGFFGNPRIEHALWDLLIIGSLITSVRMIWIMHGRPRTSSNILAYTFAPALMCVLTGQVSMFILLGLVVFFRLHSSRPFVAGVSLWLCMLKPHLFLPFGLVLLAWIIATRNYKVLAGAVSALAVSTSIALFFDPLVLKHYIQIAHTPSQTQKMMVIPCISVMLRKFIPLHSIWIQWVPPAIACLWALRYFRRHRENWNWLEHGSLLMLVSVLAAPYTWFPDQAIVIPALLHAAYKTRARFLLVILVLTSAIIEVGVVRDDAIHSFHWVWTTPVWLIWYLYATRQRDLVDGDDSLAALDGSPTVAAIG